MCERSRRETVWCTKWIVTSRINLTSSYICCDTKQYGRSQLYLCQQWQRKACSFEVSYCDSTMCHWNSGIAVQVLIFFNLLWWLERFSLIRWSCYWHLLLLICCNETLRILLTVHGCTWVRLLIEPDCWSCVVIVTVLNFLNRLTIVWKAFATAN